MRKINLIYRPKYLSKKIIQFLLQKANELESEHFDGISRLYREQAIKIGMQHKKFFKD